MQLTCCISSATLSGSADVMSILFSTGTMARFWSKARKKLATVCACNMHLLECSIRCAAYQNHDQSPTTCLHQKPQLDVCLYMQCKQPCIGVLVSRFISMANLAWYVSKWKIDMLLRVPGYCCIGMVRSMQWNSCHTAVVAGVPTNVGNSRQQAQYLTHSKHSQHQSKPVTY